MENIMRLTDLTDSMREIIKTSNIYIVSNNASIPGIGFSHFLVREGFPLILHVYKSDFPWKSFSYRKPPNQETIHVYNDPEKKNRWTVIPYKRTSKDSILGMQSMYNTPVDSQLFLYDEELIVIVDAWTHLILRNPTLCKTDPYATWKRLRDSFDASSQYSTS